MHFHKEVDCKAISIDTYKLKNILFHNLINKKLLKDVRIFQKIICRCH